MYIPPAFRLDGLADIHRAMREARSATLVTATEDGLVGTPLPMLLDESEGQNGTLYAHVARANPQWKLVPTSEGMAIFTGPQAYVTPSWYATKQETHKVVPTWNYVAVHAYGPVEFFDDPSHRGIVEKRPSGGPCGRVPDTQRMKGLESRPSRTDTSSAMPVVDPIAR